MNCVVAVEPSPVRLSAPEVKADDGQKDIKAQQPATDSKRSARAVVDDDAECKEPVFHEDPEVPKPSQPQSPLLVLQNVIMAELVAMHNVNVNLHDRVIGRLNQLQRMMIDLELKVTATRRAVRSIAKGGDVSPHMVDAATD